MSTYWDVKHRLNRAVNAHDLSGVLACYSPDAVFVSPAGVAEGHDEIGWIYQQLFKAFPDFHMAAWFEVSDCDNPAVTEWTYTGTHTGLLLVPGGHEIAGTGRRIAVRASCATHISDDRIDSHREYFDQLELYSQLGFGLVELE
ncbi:SnoaL-like polyketide cyclase [Nonomuraea coxensis DSM 45129]|uniref:SnoaL-like polyketide cyclase n=1 Tax=Nonomuraea coxensis DSM 45129 TaxID=1122611 RepID=A0ABX8TZL9_9ACTN|nr:ester cyclase [Nonomuraea coxensis]QYC40937.1 SnoaL-like polyketide cyclase [Nonomuraea coxensis DSM 45129]